MTGLNRAITIATGIAGCVSNALTELTRSRIHLDSPETTRAMPEDFSGGLDGWFWAVPIELTGVFNGSACVLLSQELVAAQDDESAGVFASLTDEELARGAEKLRAEWGGPVSLDRLGLRRTASEHAPQVLLEALGPGELVVVRYPAEVQVDGGRPSFEALVVLGGRLVLQTVGPGTEAARSPAAAKKSAPQMMARARKMRVRLGAELGRKSMTVGEVAALRPGSLIGLAKSASDPLDLWVAGKRVASGDVVVLEGGYGLRVRKVGFKQGL